jgi:phosphoglycerate dehydrogenase-like enzyme
MADAATVLVMGQLAETLERRIAREFRAVFLREPNDLQREVPWSDVEAIVIRSPFRLSGALVAGCPRLRLVIRAGAGADQIDLEALAARNIPFHSCSGGANAVAELVIGGVLALYRDFATYKMQLREGVWGKYLKRGRELACAHVGVVGFGRVGERVAELAGAFGASCVAVERDHNLNRKRERAALLGVSITTDLTATLACVDVLVLACPLTDTTRRLVDEAAIAQMRPNAVLDNVGRGALWEQEAVHRALLTRRLFGAICDVYEEEPPPPSSFFDHPRVIATPHIGAQTAEAHDRIARQVTLLLQPLAQRPAPSPQE